MKQTWKKYTSSDVVVVFSPDDHGLTSLEFIVWKKKYIITTLFCMDGVDVVATHAQKISRKLFVISCISFF
jgi:hypothetical protein